MSARMNLHWLNPEEAARRLRSVVKGTTLDHPLDDLVCLLISRACVILGERLTYLNKYAPSPVPFDKETGLPPLATLRADLEDACSAGFATMKPIEISRLRHMWKFDKLVLSVHDVLRTLLGEPLQRTYEDICKPECGTSFTHETIEINLRDPGITCTARAIVCGKSRLLAYHYPTHLSPQPILNAEDELQTFLAQYTIIEERRYVVRIGWEKSPQPTLELDKSVVSDYRRRVEIVMES